MVNVTVVNQKGLKGSRGMENLCDEDIEDLLKGVAENLLKVVGKLWKSPAMVQGGVSEERVKRLEETVKELERGQERFTKEHVEVCEFMAARDLKTNTALKSMYDCLLELKERFEKSLKWGIE